MANRSVIKSLYPMQTQDAADAIATRINELMDNKRWDKHRLAAALGVHVHSIREYLSGNSNYTLSTIIALEQVLGGKIIEVVKKEEPELI